MNDQPKDVPRRALQRDSFFVLRRDRPGRSRAKDDSASKAAVHRLARLLVTLNVVLAAMAARADIFKWEYVDPSDPNQGKRQSAELTRHGAGQIVAPHGRLFGDLRMAYLSGRDMTGITIVDVNFSDAELSRTNLTTAHLDRTTLTNASLRQADLNDAFIGNSNFSGADFTGADVRGAVLRPIIRAVGLTAQQLYSTASYQAKDLTGIGLEDHDLSGWSFAGQNLASASFSNATITGADFTGADVRGAFFPGYHPGSLTLEQLYSTSSYQMKDLTGIVFDSNNLAGWNFAGQNLTSAIFGQVVLAGTDFSGADVRGANLQSATLRGFIAEQLYSTASYQARDLTGIGLVGNDLSGWDFAGQKLVQANFGGAGIAGADFSESDVRGATFIRYALDAGGGLTRQQLYSTASYKDQNLAGITLDFIDLAGWNFAGQNLRGAGFSESTLTDVNFTGADVRGASFRNSTATGITAAQLYSTASYQSHDLTEIDLGQNDLTGWNFAGQNLAGAQFYQAALLGADFTGAKVQEANFAGATRGGFTSMQLYSTASYQAKDLTGITLGSNDLSGWNFAAQNLANADFWPIVSLVTMNRADFTGADLRGAAFLAGDGAITDNLIGPDGRINGLDLNAGELLIRDYDGDDDGDFGFGPPTQPIPITVDGHLMMGAGGTLRMILEADEWNSTISFAPDIPVTLAGTLELTFAAGVDLASQVGRTFDLFDWTDVIPGGAFIISSPYSWDLVNLYTTGEVLLAGVPEPSSLAAAVAPALILLAHRRRRLPPTRGEICLPHFNIENLRNHTT